MNHWKSALSLALVPAFALTLLSGCQQTAAPPAESSSTGKGGHVIAANTWGVGAYPLDIIFEALTPLETSAGDLSIDLANNEFKVDKVVTDLQKHLGRRWRALFGHEPNDLPNRRPTMSEL